MKLPLPLLREAWRNYEPKNPKPRKPGGPSWWSVIIVTFLLVCWLTTGIPACTMELTHHDKTEQHGH